MRALTSEKAVFCRNAADNTSMGALQPSKARPNRPRYWNISMEIIIAKACISDSEEKLDDDVQHTIPWMLTI